jgi:hypothetical protein
VSARDDYPTLVGGVLDIDEGELTAALDEIDRLRVIEAAALAYVRSDPPRPEWRTLCEALGGDWNGAT